MQDTAHKQRSTQRLPCSSGPYRHISEYPIKRLAAQHSLVLNPFDDRCRARIFAFSDSDVIADAPMTTSVRETRQYGSLGTMDSY